MDMNKSQCAQFPAKTKIREEEETRKGFTKALHTPVTPELSKISKDKCDQRAPKDVAHASVKVDRGNDELSELVQRLAEMELGKTCPSLKLDSLVAAHGGIVRVRECNKDNANITELAGSKKFDEIQRFQTPEGLRLLNSSSFNKSDNMLTFSGRRSRPRFRTSIREIEAWEMSTAITRALPNPRRTRHDAGTVGDLQGRNDCKGITLDQTILKRLFELERVK